jgi:hypothetical protein
MKLGCLKGQIVLLYDLLKISKIKFMEKNKLCPHCRKEVDIMASRCPHCHGKIYVWTTNKKVIAGIAIFLFFLYILSYGDGTSTNSSSSQSTVNPIINNTPQLELISYSCYQESGYFQITGQVKNISNQSLKNVEVVGTAYTKDGQFVNSEDFLIEYNPILVGQKSPFKVMMTNNPEMKKCNVNFKYLMGGTINTKTDATK